MTGVVNPDPVTEWRPSDLPPYLSNGLVGIRLGKMPLATGVTIVSGFESLDPDSGVEAFAPAPYPLAGDIDVDGVPLSAAPDRLVHYETRYDFSCAELRQSFVFAGQNARVTIDLISFCSRTHPTLVLQEMTLRAERDCELTLTVTIDSTGIPGRRIDPHMSDSTRASQPIDGLLAWNSAGDLGSCGMAYATELAGADGARRIIEPDVEKSPSTTYSFRAEDGRAYRLRRIVSVLPQALHNRPHIQAIRLLRAGQLRGFDGLRADNRSAWQSLWRGRVILVGAPGRWQAMSDAAYFYLHTSTHPSAPGSTSLFGLSYWPNYHYYRGHIMWDIETFAVPALILTHPAAARSLLHFRHTRMDGARANAAAAGRDGLQYPWESSMLYGQEAAPLDFALTSVEQHVSADVAIAFARYIHATGDREFAREEAWPVLSGVADWIGSRVERTGRGFEICQAVGVAEGNRTVDNNAYVNMACSVALREAAALARALNRGHPDSWERMADQMVIPRHGEGVIANHDGYEPSEEMGYTPEALAGLFPVGFVTDPDTERRTLEFYLGFARRYAGAPMLSSMLGVYAAWTGDRDAALDLFERGYADFIVDPFRITAEFSPSVYPNQPIAGPFTANLGGFLNACMYGLTGLRLKAGPPQAWCDRPITMPRGWDAVHLTQIQAHGRPASITAEHGAGCARLDLEPQ